MFGKYLIHKINLISQIGERIYLRKNGEKEREREKLK